jgi:hypothetical protein
VGKEYEIDFNLERDLLLYSSHGTHKRSFHVVIHHYCHPHHREAKAFYLLVKEKMGEWGKYLDPQVYSSKQNFRLVGSQKIGSRRPKVFCETFEYEGETILHRFDEEFEEDEDSQRLKRLTILKESLVSLTNECMYLPLFNVETEQATSYADTGDLKPEVIDKALELFEKSGNVRWEDPRFPYAVRDIKGPIISLRRLRPSKCPICRRVHQSENPYLLVAYNTVYFYCRRAETSTGPKRVEIGRLQLPQEIFQESQALGERLLTNIDSQTNENSCAEKSEASHSVQPVKDFYAGEDSTIEVSDPSPVSIKNYVPSKPPVIDFVLPVQDVLQEIFNYRP